jgi:hypothetical protein
MIVSEAHDPLADMMINLLLQRLYGRRKLVIACPVLCCTVLHIDDTLVNGLGNIPCTFCHHVGDMCIALKGHDIASHGLEEILDRLSGAMVFIPNIGETKECFR